MFIFSNVYFFKCLFFQMFIFSNVYILKCSFFEMFIFQCFPFSNVDFFRCFVFQTFLLLQFHFSSIFKFCFFSIFSFPFKKIFLQSYFIPYVLFNFSKEFFQIVVFSKCTWHLCCFLHSKCTHKLLLLLIHQMCTSEKNDSAIFTRIHN